MDNMVLVNSAIQYIGEPQGILAVPCRLCCDALPLQLSNGFCGLLGLLSCHLTSLIVSLDLSQQSSSLILGPNQWPLLLCLQLRFSFDQAINLLLQDNTTCVSAQLHAELAE